MKKYTSQFKSRVVTDIKNGATYGWVSKTHGVSEASVRNWVKKAGRMPTQNTDPNPAPTQQQIHSHMMQAQKIREIVGGLVLKANGITF